MSNNNPQSLCPNWDAPIHPLLEKGSSPIERLDAGSQLFTTLNHITEQLLMLRGQLSEAAIQDLSHYGDHQVTFATAIQAVTHLLQSAGAPIESIESIESIPPRPNDDPTTLAGHVLDPLPANHRLERERRAVHHVHDHFAKNSDTPATPR